MKATFSLLMHHLKGLRDSTGVQVLFLHVADPDSILRTLNVLAALGECVRGHS